MTRALLFGLLLALALAVAAPVAASEEKPTLAELEREVICPTCHTTLELSDAPVADRMRAFIRERIAAGDTKTEIKASLVESFGEGVLAAPPREGFNWLAWILPLAGAAAAVVAVGVAARRWVRRTPEEQPLDPELEQRLDDELARFDP